MSYFAKKAFLISLAVTGMALLSACGGGGDNNVAADVVTVATGLGTEGDFSTAIKEVVLMVSATGVKVLDMKCVSMSPEPAPPGMSVVQIQTFLILLDMSSADAEKAKVFGGFFTYGTAEASRSAVVPCR